MKTYSTVATYTNTHGTSDVLLHNHTSTRIRITHSSIIHTIPLVLATEDVIIYDAAHNNDSSSTSVRTNTGISDDNNNTIRNLNNIPDIQNIYKGVNAIAENNANPDNANLNYNPGNADASDDAHDNTCSADNAEDDNSVDNDDRDDNDSHVHNNGERGKVYCQFSYRILLRLLSLSLGSVLSL